MAVERPLQILCLHGYRQNDVFFREKTGSLRKMIKKYAELHYACAPHRPNVVSSEERGDVRAWWFSKSDAQFSSRDVTDLETGFEESVDYLVKVIKERGPFDGFLGFSQGASMTHLLLAKRQLGEIDFPMPRFVILASCFPSLSTAHTRLDEVRLQKSLRSLHIFGSADEVVRSEISRSLVSRYDGSGVSVILHDGGHFIPPMSKYKEPLLKFLQEQLTAAEEQEETREAV